MQTFLAFPDYKLSAECLDRQRLGKQRVEVKQIYNSLKNGGAWSNHPAVKMWRGHEQDLLIYGMYVCTEWHLRGYIDSLWLEFKNIVLTLPESGPPKWLGNEYVHRSHRSNLIRKLPSHYRDKLKWSERDDLAYYWPV